MTIRPLLPTSLALLLLTACGTPSSDPASPQNSDTPTATADSAAAERHDPPAAPGALAPQLSATPDGGAWLSWLEPTGDGHRLRTARFDGAAWSDAVTVARGDRFFANWADTPSVVQGADGTLLAHWLAMLGEGTYAYGVHLARSTDGGASWREVGLLHDDDSPTEHGFVSLLPAPGGGFDAVWLDGRGMADGGPMTVRHRRVEADGTLGPETVLDPRACECCQTSAARAGSSDDADGNGGGTPLVAYRDRSAGEIRDVFTTRRTDAGWSAPKAVHADGWKIPGCPVNGPTVVADGRRAAVAWFTAADATPRVRAALSRDGGATWGAPVEMDADAPLGRVDAVLLDGATTGGGTTGGGAAVVSWLGSDGGVWLRPITGDGLAGTPLRVAATSTTRASGFPRLERDGDTLYVAWVEVDEGSAGEGDTSGSDTSRTVRFATLPLSALDAPAEG